ncbi:MAG TPA: hypothetical protein DCQ26_17615 [Marinilabiliales bacterium]|nr:MAG: hypothetical protein A2W84_12590 [Bacteroidetes bacterium GWC2_40_13]OFX72924.1 MAG: hypothetical protein A2W96_04795 [Bacteroidetes bacterium GWD2_40_43]OFX91543.1 MAG: hypothetical protein A2W97_04935 [Bacteroidetes bacterium GWE2_40_63]OFY19704.1 MAG: hypothetical protein A2W88_02825 [Bacteroidetes bacterium GWF2_40_13]OFZ25454.1 MAG: hypothetical protein A2437_12815 [Bacteroidetes bacterium RIFOXYC2_FULL_40_12]HAN00416.1 hypothetical protein [Marinilabiliales bacterium]
MNEDIYPRTRLTFYIKGNDSKLYISKQTDLWRYIQFVNKQGWGLFEINYQTKVRNEHLVLVFENKLITRGNLILDDILIRPTDQNILFQDSNFYYFNNRYYAKKSNQ